MNDLVKTEKPIEIIKSLKDSDIYNAEKKSYPILYLKGIGKFCEECTKKLQPKIIKEKRNGKVIKRIQPVRKDQRFCGTNCSHKNMRRNNKLKTNSIMCRINLNVFDGAKPHRKMSIYFKKGLPFEFKITKESKELWDYLERLTRYKTIPKEIIIPCQ